MSNRRARDFGLRAAPLIGFYPDGERPDAALVPDVVVAPTAADVAAGVDVELAAVRAKVKGR